MEEIIIKFRNRIVTRGKNKIEHIWIQKLENLIT